jgi:hypothetical protein
MPAIRNVPYSIPIGKIDEILEKLDPEKVAIAYPSFRHPENIKNDVYPGLP